MISWSLSISSDPREITREDIIRVTRGEVITIPFDGYLQSDLASYRMFLKAQEKIKLLEIDLEFEKEKNKAEIEHKDKLIDIERDAYDKLKKSDEKLLKEQKLKKYIWMGVGVGIGILCGIFIGKYAL
jgi:hypothetical protein